MHSIANFIVLFIVKNSSVEINQQDWCVYALEKRLYKVLCFVLTVIVGALLRAPVESAFVFLSTNYLRTRVSGWHAESPVICVLLTVLISCGCGALSKITMPFYALIYFLLLIVNFLLFCFYTPLKNSHLHLTAEELEKSKDLAKFRIWILFVFSAVLLLFASTRMFSICMQLGCFISLGSTLFDERRCDDAIN